MRNSDNQTMSEIDAYFQRRKTGQIVIPDADENRIHLNLKKDIIESINSKSFPIVISGDVGTGKTYAMACIFNAWKVRTGEAIIWRNCGELLNQIMQCRTSVNKSIQVTRHDGLSYTEFENSIMRKISEAKLLCLDDVGVRRPTEAQREVFNNILDSRHDDKKNLATIVTTNLHTEKMFTDVFDERSFSRLFSGRSIIVRGKDRRLENSSGGFCDV